MLISIIGEYLSQFVYSPNHSMAFQTRMFFTLFTLLFGIHLLVYKYPTIRALLILVFSLFFYYKAGDYPVVIMITSMALINYGIGLWINTYHQDNQRRNITIIGVVINLCVLGYFKYTNFFIQTYYNLFSPHTSTDKIPFIKHVVETVGLSFYTFKALSYLFDIKRRIIEPCKNFFDFYLYLVFFGNVLMGPIDKASQFIPQIRQPYILTMEQASKAFYLIMVGFFKKVFIADYIHANFIGRLFDQPNLYTGFENLMVLYAFGIQIYCDFSGYVDMATGFSMLLGFNLTANFNSPFLAQNMTEFWRRWHISLSTWFNDYVFMPLTISLRNWGVWASVLGVIVVFFLSGIWHNPSWNFVLWGLSHGVVIAFETATRRQRKKWAKSLPTVLYNSMSWLLTFHFIIFTYILFNCKELDKIGTMLNRIAFHFNWEAIPKIWANSYNVFLLMILGYLLHFTPRVYKEFVIERYIYAPGVIKVLIAVILIVVVYQIQQAESIPFIYTDY
ncbi:MAG: hypothetical protein NZ455_04665 [Bacteroidia bacterium]|nr:hypothetical protein [Bacteroidia bacterium]MDW8346135.1 MBOAT family O-acyltransferase [Bacteroidia bacterium]